ncbi:hypothetical protein ACI3KS_02810 [Microbacterium sp. ZW T5_45]|uniref:hypothetical protein n=1 Tax=Microbacterium sp. ZW T5_45 TaxID=3378080 RepID=UPI0038552426
MLELLHAGSLAATAAGACCVAVERRGPRIRSFLLAAVMTLAMLDVVVGARLLPVVAWSALTIALAMVLAVRRRTVVEAADVSRMRVLSALGAVLMAVLMLTMSMGSFQAGHHGAASSTVVAWIVAASIGHAAWTALSLRTTHDLLARLQLVSMSGAVLLLAAGHALS